MTAQIIDARDTLKHALNLMMAVQIMTESKSMGITEGSAVSAVISVAMDALAEADRHLDSAFEAIA